LKKIKENNHDCYSSKEKRRVQKKKKRRERLKRKETTQYFVKIVEIFLLSLVNDNSNLNFETYVL
jgi:hypothetical protein